VNIIAVDIGNSSIKISAGSKETLVRVKIDVMDELNSIAAPSDSNHWVIVSVAPDKTKKLTTWLAANRPNEKATVISNDQVPIKSSVKNHAAVGTDRLVAAYAVNQIRDNQERESEEQEPQSAVIVDMGTAVTIDYLNKQGTFCGGLIFPGMSTNLRSLATDTANLPDLANTKTEPVTYDIRIGDDTQSAIRYGVTQSQAWGILTITQKMAEQNDANVFVTGGDAELIKSIAPVSWQFVPDLIHQGCRQLFATPN